MNKEKYVDESWKEQASQEKDVLASVPDQQDEQNQPSIIEITPETVPEAAPEVAADQAVDDPQAMEVNFLNYITSLGFQAMIFLGEIPNPMSNKVEKNLDQAKFLIDTLAMLKEKTNGNLNEQENSLLENSVYELQNRYVQISTGEDPSQEPAA